MSPILQTAGRVAVSKNYPQLFNKNYHVISSGFITKKLCIFLTSGVARARTLGVSIGAYHCIKHLSG